MVNKNADGGRRRRGTRGEEREERNERRGTRGRQEGYYSSDLCCEENGISIMACWGRARGNSLQSLVIKELVSFMKVFFPKWPD